MHTISILTVLSHHKYIYTHLYVTWSHGNLMHVLCGYILSFKHVSHERKYLHPETLIITLIHKRRPRHQTNYIKRIPTGIFFFFRSQNIFHSLDRPAEYIGSSNYFFLLKIYFLPYSKLRNPSPNASS